MKWKIIKTFICVFCAMAFAGNLSAEINVVATLPWIGDIAKQIGKEKVSVTTLVKTGQDPHYVEAKPGLIIAARKADIIMYNGLDLEIGYLPVIIESSKNPNIQPGKIGNFDCSKFVSPIEKPSSVDRSMGDIHPLGNPHYHFSPASILAVAKGMADTLAEIDPTNKSHYQKNYQLFYEKWQEKMAQWKSKNLVGKKFIAYHTLFSYLANEFGFQIAGCIEAKPGIPPSSGDIKKIIDTANRVKPNAILFNVYSPKKPVEFIANKTGLKTILVPHDVGSLPQTDDWFSFMDKVISLLSEA
ncbi:MAG: metal ABC transporter substrate-binding protein [Candidatus Omnitrophica bacterium]|nr:metal ABC transporter substrate-binding protein [Candidatus Omnitrophota bacterium]MCM8824950.1 metal ABC transporter substrate-binding protein [Candidatus Omnitrophota bacterium]